MEEKLVSVCINAYNASNTIAETLKSVRGQTYNNLQIIVVDDASDDNTAEMVKAFPDSRVELYRLEKNGHISNANNVAFSKAKGEFVAHIDSDDLMDSMLIETAINYLSENSQCGACFFKPILVDETGKPISEEFKWIQDVYNVSAKTQAEFVRLFFESSNHLSYAGTVMRKSVIEDIGIHYPSYCYLHDFDYWARLIIKYPIKLFDEPMTKYRQSTSEEHNSRLDESKANVHNAEYAQIIYNMINDCPDELFLEAFSDKLIIKGVHSHEETEIEKAVILKQGLIFAPNNEILGVLKFSQLFKDYKYVELARDKFGINIRDFYSSEKAKFFYNSEEVRIIKDTLQHEINLHSITKEELSNKNTRLAQCTDELNNTRNELNNTRNQLEITNGELQSTREQLDFTVNEFHKTFDYRIKQKVKSAIKSVKHLKHFLFIRGKDGRKYKHIVMLYGYFAMNLGDDLFFETLFKRYPDTMFLFYCDWNYSQFAEKFNNVKFYCSQEPFVARVNNFGLKKGVRDCFEYFLLHKSNATLHLGGSIYQQVGDYMLDFELRKRRKRVGKPFYSVSCNFGAYETEEFKKMWTKQFKKFKDICFRETYSAELFKDLKNVRYAPDLLFSYNMPNEEEIPDSLAISVIDPFIPSRKISNENALSYQMAIEKTIKESVAKKHKTSVISFCSFEGDNGFIDKVMQNLTAEERAEVEVLSYSFENKEQILKALASAEYIVGTRLHSVILGLNMGKKVLPISYSNKIKHILEDIKYDKKVISFEEMSKYAVSGFINELKMLERFELPFNKEQAEKQFEQLDKFLK